MPDYAAWGPDGSLYVTDYQQAVVWRVPPHGGTPTVWLADPRLDGNMFGTAGIELAADRRTLLITQASEAGLGGLTSGGLGGLGLPLPPLPVKLAADAPLSPADGALYSVAIGSGGHAGALHLVWSSAAADAPDGLAIARSGNVYIALSGTNELLELAPSGAEMTRFPGSPGSGANGSFVPFDTPSSVMFLGTRLIVANQGYVSGNQAHMAILDVETGEPGLTPFIPASAGRPAIRRVASAKHRVGATKRRRPPAAAKRRRAAVRRPHRSPVRRRTSGLG